MHIYLTKGKDGGFDHIGRIGKVDSLLTEFMISKLAC